MFAWLNKYVLISFINPKGDYRSRAAFKLKQLDNKYSLLRKNQVVIELGCFPGGWSQVILERTEPSTSNSLIIGVDKHRPDVLEHYVAIQGEVGTPEVHSRLLAELGERRVDLILSDMAPATTGIKGDDSVASAELALRAGELAENVLKENGCLVAKFFMGPSQNQLKIYLMSIFKTVTACKPHASRSDSPEMFYICKGFKGRPKMSQEIFTRTPFADTKRFEGREVPIIPPPMLDPLFHNKKRKVDP